MFKRLGVWLRPILLACLTWAGSVSGASYQVTLDTSHLSGQAQIAFDFIDGGSPLNSITLSGFTPGDVFSSPNATGDVTGTFPGPITLGGTQFFTEFRATVTLGGNIGFVLDATTNGPDPGSLVDAFSLFLLDPNTGLPLLGTSDPTGAGALFFHEIDGTSPGQISIYDNANLVGIATGPAGGATLDVDGSATATKFDALTDGMLIVRYLFGLTGTPLTTGAVGATATRTDPAAIKAYLDSIRPALDIDGNGTADALTDGMLILRYLFGLRGDALIAGAVGPGATRTTAAAIEDYLKTLLP